MSKRITILAVLFGTLAVIRFTVNKPSINDDFYQSTNCTYRTRENPTVREESAFAKYDKELASRFDRQLPLATVERWSLNN